jgi:hypothetical protein
MLFVPVALGPQQTATNSAHLQDAALSMSHPTIEHPHANILMLILRQQTPLPHGHCSTAYDAPSGTSFPVIVFPHKVLLSVPWTSAKKGITAAVTLTAVARRAKLWQFQCSNLGEANQRIMKGNNAPMQVNAP